MHDDSRNDLREVIEQACQEWQHDVHAANVVTLTDYLFGALDSAGYEIGPKGTWWGKMMKPPGNVAEDDLIIGFIKPINETIY
jgi:hypothetical protein